MNTIHLQEKSVFPIRYRTNFGGMTTINCYIYKTANRVYLVDAGISSPSFQQYFYEKLDGYGLSINDIDAIVLTHHHGDHIGIVNEIVLQRDIPIYAHSLALERLYVTEQYKKEKISFFERIYTEYGCYHLGKGRLEKIRSNFSTNNYAKIYTKVQPLQDGQQIGDLQVIYAPGHSPDSVMFYDANARWLFAGDNLLYNKNTSALVDFDSELQLIPAVSQYARTLALCESLEADYIFAGHEAVITNGNEAISRNKRRIDMQLQRVVHAVTDGHNTVQKIGYSLYKERFESLFIFTFSEIVGYTNYAIELGLLEKYWENNCWNFRVTDFHFNGNIISNY